MEMAVDEESTPPISTDMLHLRHQADDGSEIYYDEATGLELPREAVLQARAEELSDYTAMDVYEEVGLDEAIQAAGGAYPISTRWKDINKGDINSMQVRSRLIGRQFKQWGIDSSFTATPPWAGFRALCSSLMTRRADQHGRVLLLLDVKRAFLHTPT
eukprot:159355-Amphidinium_carterae.1